MPPLLPQPSTGRKPTAPPSKVHTRQRSVADNPAKKARETPDPVSRKSQASAKENLVKGRPESLVPTKLKPSTAPTKPARAPAKPVKVLSQNVNNATSPPRPTPLRPRQTAAPVAAPGAPKKGPAFTRHTISSSARTGAPVSPRTRARPASPPTPSPAKPPPTSAFGRSIPRHARSNAVYNAQFRAQSPRRDSVAGTAAGSSPGQPTRPQFNRSGGVSRSSSASSTAGTRLPALSKTSLTRASSVTQRNTSGLGSRVKRTGDVPAAAATDEVLSRLFTSALDEDDAELRKKHPVLPPLLLATTEDGVVLGAVNPHPSFSTLLLKGSPGLYGAFVNKTDQVELERSVEPGRLPGSSVDASQGSTFQQESRDVEDEDAIVASFGRMFSTPLEDEDIDESDDGSEWAADFSDTPPSEVDPAVRSGPAVKEVQMTTLQPRSCVVQDWTGELGTRVIVIQDDVPQPLVDKDTVIATPSALAELGLTTSPSDLAMFVFVRKGPKHLGDYGQPAATMTDATARHTGVILTHPSSPERGPAAKGLSSRVTACFKGWKKGGCASQTETVPTTPATPARSISDQGEDSSCSTSVTSSDAPSAVSLPDVPSPSTAKSSKVGYFRRWFGTRA